MILNRFRNLQVLPALNNIGEFIDAKSMSKVKLSAQSLKASSASIGAAMLHYDCYFIQEAHESGRVDDIIKRYNRLIEDSIEFMDYCESYLNQNKSKVGTKIEIN